MKTYLPIIVFASYLAIMAGSGLLVCHGSILWTLARIGAALVLYLALLGIGAELYTNGHYWDDVRDNDKPSS